MVENIPNLIKLKNMPLFLSTIIYTYTYFVIKLQFNQVQNKIQQIFTTNPSCTK
jgi:hypothetical protein